MTQNILLMTIVVFLPHVNCLYEGRMVCRMIYFKSKVVDYNWFAAADYCVSTGAALASIDTPESHRFFLASTRSSSSTPVAIWLGASGFVSDLMWMNNRYVSEGFVNWAPGHPMKEQKILCVSFNETMKRWVTTDCYQSSGAAYCEKCIEPTCAMANCSLLCICQNFMSCVTSATSCSSGCQIAHLSRITSLTCANNKYGRKCDLQCFCENGVPCERVLGHCPAGCQLGWQGVRCDTTLCSNNRWGPNCALDCYCKNGAHCNKATGRCISGCTNGVSGLSCNKSAGCPSYKWGDDCSYTCNYCGGDGFCNSETGVCLDTTKECKFEYEGPSCNTPSHNDCKIHRWGEHCDRSCFCNGSIPCYKKNGVCENGCVEGVTGESCNQTIGECPLNRWGPDCHFACHCAESRQCHKATGVCLTHDNICDPDWHGPSCNLTVCPLYFYGPKCLEACNCANGNQCPVNLGICPDNLCLEGWSGSNCNQINC